MSAGLRDGTQTFGPGSGAVGQGGFGMIEILVAVLVLAIGLLGMASLQVSSLGMTTGSWNRSQAVLLADDLIERARANREHISHYAVDAGDRPDCSRTYAVENKNVTAEDVTEWRNSVACLLPDGNAKAVVSGNVMSVTVTWNARSNAAIDGSIHVEADI